MKSPLELIYGNLAYERAVISNPAAYTYGAVEAAAKTILARMDLFEKIITEKEMLTAAPKQPSAIDALQAIANLPTGRTEEVMEGHEDAYRAVEKLFDTQPRIEGSGTPPSPETHVVGEQHPDDLAVDRFAAAMKAKLAAKRAEGMGGWDDPEVCHIDYLAHLLKEQIHSRAALDLVDIGNFAMMIFNRGETPSHGR